MTATTSSTSPTSSSTPPLFDASRELRVMVDGSERAVCGLSVATTCQDVIYALAHATGQTGRFVLIEQWHSSERCLAPHDRPLELLDRWKEHSGSVRFVLKLLEAGAHQPTAPRSTRPHVHLGGEAHSFGSLPRARPGVGGHRPHSVLADQSPSGNGTRTRASSHRPPLPSYEEAMARRQLLLRAQSQRPPECAQQAAKPDREALLKKVLEQKQRINEQDGDIKQHQTEDVRVSRELGGIEQQIEWYERQKVTLRRQIDALDVQCARDHGVDVTDTSVTTTPVDAEHIDRRLCALDAQLGEKSAEISSLQAQIAQIAADCPPDGNNNYVERATNDDEIEKQLRSIDQQMSTRLAILKEMRVQANKMGIKTKPGVWV